MGPSAEAGKHSSPESSFLAQDWVKPAFTSLSKQGGKVPFIWDGILKSPFASHPPRWMFPYSLPLQWLSINNPIIYKVTNLNSLDVFDVVDIEVFEEG